MIGWIEDQNWNKLKNVSIFPMYNVYSVESSVKLHGFEYIKFGHHFIKFFDWFDKDYFKRRMGKKLLTDL